MYGELYIRTQYDGHDYISIMEIYHYDKEGDEQELENLTELCIDISTCADQGSDTWSWLIEQVAARLETAGVAYSELYFDPYEPCI